MEAYLEQHDACASPFTRLPIRCHPAASAGARARGASGADRRQPGEALKCTKTEASRRALQAIALDAIDRQPPSSRSQLLFPADRGGYLDLRNLRNREWKPAQLAAGIEPLRRIYDLRHTFATFALRAGISTFDLSRYTGVSLTMIDRHYGHLARDGCEHAIRLLDYLSAGQWPRWTLPRAQQSARRLHRLNQLRRGFASLVCDTPSSVDGLCSLLRRALMGGVESPL